MPFPKRKRLEAPGTRVHTKELYGLKWNPLNHPLSIEMVMIEHGGQWTQKSGVNAGNGLMFHFKEAIKILWPEIEQHRWFDLILENWLTHKYVAIMGPKSCVAGETRILNPLTGKQPTIKWLCENGIAPVVMTLDGPVQATVPFVKGRDQLYEVRLSNGACFRATGGHRLLSETGYVPVSSCFPGALLQGYEPFLPRSTSDTFRSIHVSGVPSFLKTVPGFPIGCLRGPGSCDEQLLWGAEIFQGELPLPVDARARNAYILHKDVPVYKSGYSHSYQQLSHHSINDYQTRWDHQSETYESLHYVQETFSPFSLSFQLLEQLPFGSHPRQSIEAPTLCSFRTLQNHVLACNEYWVRNVEVASIKCVGEDYFYDLHVPGPNHYFAEGAIHHNSSKTCSAAIIHLMDYYCFPNDTTVILCSDTTENLEDRIWGEVKKFHRLAKSRFSWIPGNLIEGRMRMVTDDREDAEEGRDMRAGFRCVPVRVGSAYQGLSSFVGRKNKRVRICGDEISLLNKSFIDAIASSQPGDYKITGMGNPSQTTDALGLLAEPDVTLGGWDGGIDQSPKTKTWKTRWPNGICIQLPGADCPNMDVGPDDPVPFPFLITRKQMEEDAKIWGKDDWHYTMFNEGRMPRGQGSRRIITRQLCLRHGAMEDPIWKDPNRTKIVGLDAAYRAVGGDRCVLTTIEFGEEGVLKDLGQEVVENLINQSSPSFQKRLILALIDVSIIPIKASDFESPEDQIVMFTKAHCEQRNIPPKNLFFDSGMRTSLVTAFSRLWSVDVNPIDCGGKPSDRQVSENITLPAHEYYSKKITELWYTVSLIITAGQFRGMTEDVMMEFCAREWKTVGNNKIEAEAKSDMKQKIGKSPDLADATTMAVEGARQRGFLIRRLANKEAVEHDDRWKKELRKKALELNQSKQLNYAA